MRWFRKALSDGEPTVRLFCFPYAGGNASIYSTWRHQLPSEIEIVAAQLPGRGSRFNEAPFETMESLVSAFSEAMIPLLDRPYMLFGHSMGATIAFEIAKKLSSLPNKPAHLFLSGQIAPPCMSGKKQLHAMSDEDFIKELRVLNGTPPQIFENIELLTFLLPCMRADFKLLETYRHQAGAALELAATIFSGAQDTETPKDDIRAWISCLSGEISFYEYDGDHFFLLNQDNLVSILHQIVITAKSLSPTPA